MIREYLDKNNLHHAYLIEGGKDLILPSLIDFLGEIGVKREGNVDLVEISLDSIKIDDARTIRSLTVERSTNQGKKVFIVTANSILLEAQNTMLKMFEEPIEDTHFFVIMPDTRALLETFTSRFYSIKLDGSLDEKKNAESFLTMPLSGRLNFIKDFLTVDDEESESARTKALKFLDALESTLYKKKKDAKSFNHIFQVRKFLRQPGSSPKTLLESVALIIPR